LVALLELDPDIHAFWPTGPTQFPRPRGFSSPPLRVEKSDCILLLILAG